MKVGAMVSSLSVWLEKDKSPKESCGLGSRIDAPYQGISEQMK